MLSRVGTPDGIHNFLDFKHPVQTKAMIIDAVDGRVEIAPKRKKVALVGYAETTRHLAPFFDEEWEVWGLNQLNRWIPRADRWFEMHSEWNAGVVEGTDYPTFLKNLPIPVYMSKLVPGIPNCVRYPKERILENLCVKYFTSTIAEMLGLAIMEGFETIGLFGIDLAVDEEWSYQKPCAEFWLGVAHGRNIQLILPEQTALLKSRGMYGYNENIDIPIPTKLLKDELTKYKERIEILKGQLHSVQGAAQMLETLIHMQEVWEHGGVPTSIARKPTQSFDGRHG